MQRAFYLRFCGSFGNVIHATARITSCQCSFQSTYVCMCVLMYVCVYVCVCTCVWTYVCVYVCMYVYTYVCVYVLDNKVHLRVLTFDCWTLLLTFFILYYEWKDLLYCISFYIESRISSL